MSTLHDDAVRVKIGLMDFYNSRVENLLELPLGYHAKWVQREGVANGNCIKFSDTNDVLRRFGRVSLMVVLIVSYL